MRQRQKLVRRIKIVILSLAIVVCVASAFYAGANWGVKQWLHLNSVVLATYDIQVLRALRRADTDSALRLVDMQLNLRILDHYNFQPGWTRVFWNLDMRALAAEVPKLSAIVVDYRQAHPIVRDHYKDWSPLLMEDVGKGMSLLESEKTKMDAGVTH